MQFVSTATAKQLRPQPEQPRRSVFEDSYVPAGKTSLDELVESFAAVIFAYDVPNHAEIAVLQDAEFASLAIELE